MFYLGSLFMDRVQMLQGFRATTKRLLVTSLLVTSLHFYKFTFLFNPHEFLILI